MRRVLFICYGNTCRSVLAEHIARKKFQGNPIQFESAGVHPHQSGSDAQSALDMGFSFAR
jgi:protein-tyrosine-phosphatase